MSQELREGEGGSLPQWRGIVALELAAAGSMGLIALYQMGILRHLPEPPLPGFDADKVDASEEACSRFQMGDAFLGLGSYAATTGLAAMGGADRAKSQPWIPLALVAKTGLDAAQAAKLTVDQWTKHKAFCSWCLLAAATTFAA
ncbi:MAG: vitamin K epoxide reductase family protein, partial [Chthoniobacterales bacterium]